MGGMNRTLKIIAGVVLALVGFVVAVVANSLKHEALTLEQLRLVEIAKLGGSLVILAGVYLTGVLPKIRWK